jgi:hypothetical protein
MACAAITGPRHRAWCRLYSIGEKNFTSHWIDFSLHSGDENNVIDRTSRSIGGFATGYGYYRKMDTEKGIRRG